VCLPVLSVAVLPTTAQVLVRLLPAEHYIKSGAYNLQLVQHGLYDEWRNGEGGVCCWSTAERAPDLLRLRDETQMANALAAESGTAGDVSD